MGTAYIISVNIFIIILIKVQKTRYVFLSLVNVIKIGVLPLFSNESDMPGFS